MACTRMGEPVVSRRIPEPTLKRGQKPIRRPTTGAAGSYQGRACRRLEGNALGRGQRRSEFGNQSVKIGIASRRYCHETTSVKW